MKGSNLVKVLHIMNESNINESYIKFINKNFSVNEHIYYYYCGRGNANTKVSDGLNVILNNKIKNKWLEIIEMFLILNRYSYKAEKIMLHGIFNPRVLLFLSFQPWLLKKSNWVIWGGDLYDYQKPKITTKQKLYEFMRAFCIKRFGGLITYIKGDYDLAKKWYGAKGTYYECIMYPSNLYKELEINRLENQDKIYIQLGNSADPSNEHLEILERLEQYKNENIEIICPLSYGNKEYASKIKKIGEEKFGNKFVALMDFMPFEKYLQILGKIDIAIFNHDRQQAMGNIITLLGLGKKVYIRKGITTEELFEEKQIQVFDNKNIKISQMNEKIKIENSKRVKEYFSNENLKTQLCEIFKV